MMSKSGAGRRLGADLRSQVDHDGLHWAALAALDRPTQACQATVVSRAATSKG
jgi:hypothetical protein